MPDHEYPAAREHFDSTGKSEDRIEDAEVGAEAEVEVEYPRSFFALTTALHNILDADFLAGDGETPDFIDSYDMSARNMQDWSPLAIQIEAVDTPDGQAECKGFAPGVFAKMDQFFYDMAALGTSGVTINRDDMVINASGPRALYQLIEDYIVSTRYRVDTGECYLSAELADPQESGYGALDYRVRQFSGFGREGFDDTSFVTNFMESASGRIYTDITELHIHAGTIDQSAAYLFNLKHLHAIVEIETAAPGQARNIFPLFEAH